jgi:hypothetical protein
VNFASFLVFARKNLRRIEAIAIIVAIVGAAVTLAIGGSVRSDTIRIVDVSNSMSSPYGESSSGTVVGYDDNYSGWAPSQTTAQVNTTKNSLVVRGAFQNDSSWTAVSFFKTVTINITAFPILTVNVNLTTGPRYGVRFFSQYPNGTEYNVWWEGSPLDHRPGIGYESLRVNMQREAFLATNHTVQTINKMALYIEDPPHSPQSFQFTLSKLSLEDDSLEQVSNNQYRAIYFDLKNTPQENASWSLNKIDYGITVQATQGTTFSIYFFDGPVLYSSSTATGQLYNSLTPSSQITFYLNLQPQVFPELLPPSNTSIVFVATSGTLQSVTVQYANFEFLPTRVIPDLTQQTLGLYYVYFIFFLFLLPVGIAILVFREFLPRSSVPKGSILAVLVAGVLCRIALAATTSHVFDMNVYLTSIRGWFQYRTPEGSLGPTLPFTFFLYWIFYSPYALLQLAGFRDAQILGHAAGLVESVFVKLFPMVMDVSTFFLLLRFRKDGATFVWGTFYFLNPLSIFVSSVWGQYEAATVTFIVWGVYWMSRQKTAIAALAFIVSGMVELFGFFPYLLLLLRAARMKLYRTIPIVILAIVPVVIYLPEAVQIFRLLLGFAGVNVANSALSQPGRFSLFGNFSQLSIFSQFKPLLLSEAIVLGAAIFDTYRKRMNVERIVFYMALSSVFFLLFSNLIAFWFWLLPVCLLYAIIREKKDLGAFMLVFGTSVAFLEVTYAFSSNYLIFGNFGAIVPSIEGIKNALKITSIMATSLAIILLFFLKYGSGRANETMLRTAGISLSIYLLLYFWLGVYPL